MERHCQGATEYLLPLAAIMLVAGAIVYTIYATSKGLGSSVRGEIDKVRDNIIMPGLVGMI
jgi:hypothetical protein